MNQELLNKIEPLKFPIEMRPIPSIPTELGRQLVRLDRAPATPLAIHKSRYKPITHTEAFEPSLMAMEQAGLDLDNVDMVVEQQQDGAMASIDVTLKSHTMKIGNHQLFLKYVARNSYNQVWKYQSFFGWMNEVCFNTLVSGQKLSYTSNRHTLRFDPKSTVNKIKKAVEIVQNDKPLFDKWWNTPITDNQALNLFSNTLVKYKKTDAQIMLGQRETNQKQLSVLMENFQQESIHLHGSGDYQKKSKNEGTLWCAFQSATAWSTHCRDAIDGRSTYKLKEEREQKVKSMINSQSWIALEAA